MKHGLIGFEAIRNRRVNKEKKRVMALENKDRDLIRVNELSVYIIQYSPILKFNLMLIETIDFYLWTCRTIACEYIKMHFNYGVIAEGSL